MTLVKTQVALWVLAFVLLARSIVDAPGAAVQYDTNTVASGQVQYWNGSAWAAVVTTAAGRSMMTAADAAAQRTLLSLGTAALVADNTLVHLAGAETITGEKTFNANAIFRGQDRVYIGTSQASYFTRADAGALPGFDYITPSTGIFRVTTASVFATDDLFFQGIPPSGAAFGFESGNNADFYIGPGNSGRALHLTSNRIARARATDSGFTIGRTSEGTAMRGVYHGTTPALSSGVHTETAAWVTAGTRIIPNWDVDGGTPGVRLAITKSAGASFTITSKDASNATATGDTSTVSWIAIVP